MTNNEQTATGALTC